MAVRKPAPKQQPKKVKETRSGVEQQVMAFADQLGWSLGTIRAKADGGLDREAVRSEVMHIRNSAEHLLEHFNHEGVLPNGNGASSSNGARKPAVAATLGASRGAKKMARTTGKHAMRYGRS